MLVHRAADSDLAQLRSAMAVAATDMLELEEFLAMIEHQVAISVPGDLAAYFGKV